MVVDKDLCGLNDVVRGVQPKVDHAFCVQCDKEFFLDEAKSEYFCNSLCSESFMRAHNPRWLPSIKESGAVLNDW